MNRERIEGSATEGSYQSRYAAIAVPVPVRRLFTYRIPPGLEGCSEPGARAIVPFGRRLLAGVITSVCTETDLDPTKVKDVRALPDQAPVLAAALLETLLRAARHYVSPPGTMLAAALPPGAGRSGFAAEAAAETFYSLAAEPEAARGLCALAPRQRSIVDLLAASTGDVSWKEIRDRLGEIGPALHALRKKGIVRTERRHVERDHAERRPELLPAGGEVSRHTLTSEQAAAVSAVGEAVRSGRPKGFLLMGPTGSGKTEVYLSAIEQALAAGRGAVYLVPEISLTPLLARTLAGRFGGDFALLHSSLTGAQRRTEWNRIRDGRARVVLGPRSALLSPLEKPGLIVVDEEQDGSFKQESDPRYNARDMAMVRARNERAALLLGSATPSLESFSLAASGKLELLTLSSRIASRPVASVELVDMRTEAKETGGDDAISRRLREAMRECLSRGEQAIVLLNRRGWSPSILCRRCGENVQCRRCTIALTYHKSDRRLLCHYCGYHRGFPARCPTCAAEELVLTGQGTERLSETLGELFPAARLARLDRDIARGRTEPGRILAAFERGEHDLLVGTQLVAKGHDFPNVTLVGVVSADFSLGFPDFRSAERTFQLLTQVAGRAGRGEKPGTVIVQAYRPDHYAVQAAAAQDYAEFYRKESRFRKLMGYPPFSALANVIASARTPEGALRRARSAAAAIREAGGGRLRVSGPAVAPIARLKGRYRMQIMVRAPARRLLSDALNAAMERIEAAPRAGRDLIVDVDPASLL